MLFSWPPKIYPQGLRLKCWQSKCKYEPGQHKCWSKKPQRSALQDLWDRKPTKTGILEMWQCELILEVVTCAMGMFYKQEFKRRNRRRAWRRRAVEHEVLLSVFTVKPFSLAKTTTACRRCRNQKQTKAKALLLGKTMELATNTQQLGGLGQRPHTQDLNLSSYILEETSPTS